MFVYIRLSFFVALSVSALGGCAPEAPAGPAAAGRWYTSEQLDNGQALFQAHCASCHGDRAQGLAADWRKADADGNYPPPPLNGTAHAWHHAMVILEKTITDGGAALGGVMPGFSETLSADETRATIAYFQGLWTDETYARWQEINER